MNPYEQPDAETRPNIDAQVPPDAPQKPLPGDNVGMGCLYWILGLLATSFTLAITFKDLAIVLGVAIGVAQFVFVIPLWIYLHKTQRRQTLKGLLVSAGVAFLLNGGCFAIVLTQGLNGL